MSEDPIQYGAHDQATDSIGAAERAAIKSTLEKRGERATHRAIRQERDEHFQRALKVMSQVDYPEINTQSKPDARGKDPRVTGTLTAEFAIAGGQFAVIDFNGTIREYIA